MARAVRGDASGLSPRALALAGALAVSCAGAVAASALPSETERWAAACNGCHGPNGEGSGAIPALRGQSAKALQATLLAWQQDPALDQRHVMVRFLKPLDPALLEGLAQHYGTSP